MGSFQCRCIVCTVASHGYNFIICLECLNQTLLIHRAGTGNNLQFSDTFTELTVRKFCELNTGDDIAVGVSFVIPKTNLASDFLCCSGRIACYNFNLDSCVDYLVDGIWYIDTYRVGNSHNSEECKIVGNDFAIFNRRIIVVKFLISEAEGTHSLILIFEKLCINLFIGYTTGVFAHSENDFGCAFDVEYIFAGG